MTILAVLLVLVAGAARSFRENLNLARAGQLLGDEIGAARQLASAHDWTVYVYLYKVPTASPVGYSALQLWRRAPPASAATVPEMIPLEPAYFLPSAVVISEDATHNSPLLALLAAQTGQPPPLVHLPPNLAGASWVALAVRPGGTLALEGLPPSAATTLTACCLTVVPARLGSQTAAPANFVTVQINPYTGTPLVYQP